MGDIKKQKSKFERPTHLWEADRLEEEKELMKEYGLRNKKELWRFRSMLRGFRTQAKSLVTKPEEQGKREEQMLIDKLVKLGLIKKGAKKDDILSLDLKKLLDRRLQTQVLVLGLAKTASQSRQFIVHGHILVNNNKVSVPSYLVKEGDNISFIGSSTLAKDDHPERIEATTKEKRSKIIKKEKPKEKIKEKPKKEVKVEKKPKVEKKKEEVKVKKSE